MSQMCPNCSFDNPDDAGSCARCPATLRGLLGENSMLSERYKVTAVLGCGAMGAVYLAEDTRLAGRRCAIKENRPQPNASVDIKKQSREQFLAEASIMARLDHANLPKVSDYFIEGDDEREYLVMDYVEGEDLDSRIQSAQAPLPEELVLGWADQVLDALAYLHSQQPQPIVHRDIKPANLRVDLRNRVKLVDFGLVKLLDSDNPATKVELRGLGTPAYAPLEQFADSDTHTDARSDIYSLGATMYHLLTHLYPPDVHQRVLHPETLILPRELNAHLSEQTAQVVLKAMAVHPNDRYQSADDMRQAIANTQHPANAPSTAAPIPAPAAAEKKAKAAVPAWLFGLIGFIVVLLILGGVAFFVLGGLNGDAPATPAPAVAADDATLTPTAVPPTPTELVVQALGDAPTDTPTPVVKATTVSDQLPSSTDAPNDNGEIETPESDPDTETPEPAEADTSEATAAPQVSQPGGISAASLAGTIAYPVFNGESYDLYLGQADGSGTEFFLSDASQPAFSPDGAKITYHSWKLDNRGLITMNLDGSNPKRVAAFFEDQLPTWSADGSEIILLSRREGDRKSRLVRVGSTQENSNGVNFAEGEYPTIGSNGNLVFRGWGATALGLRLAPPPYDTFQPLTDHQSDTAPALSPDGQKIAFMSQRDENWEIYIVNADGSNLQRLTENPAQDGLPAWSPDGQAIAFVSDRDGAWAVWAVTPTGQDAQPLFAMEGSPDGFVGTDQSASRGWAEERISWK